MYKQEGSNDTPKYTNLGAVALSPEGNTMGHRKHLFIHSFSKDLLSIYSHTSMSWDYKEKENMVSVL